jgi:hypothetical protein
VQRQAEVDIVTALAADQSLKLNSKPGRVTLRGGVWVEVDARSDNGSVFVEAYARQGELKGAQLKKIGQDILKLALLSQKTARHPPGDRATGPSRGRAHSREFAEQPPMHHLPPTTST